eukprot:TRINITY_DN91119_c0_g1_i1.p1 TRINITY_DN91119_c0_g1~~TRINITY_DN91119_c0_g1_i1.p1  ORF type:complete len:623 (-),score=96.37 TRINITY_DN91119_c0_g1_i1:83-1951(-)
MIAFLENLSLLSAAVGVGLFAAVKLATRQLPVRTGHRDEAPSPKKDVEAKLDEDVADSLSRGQQSVPEPHAEPECEPSDNEVCQVKAEAAPQVAAPKPARRSIQHQAATWFFVVFLVLSIVRLCAFLGHGASPVMSDTTQPPVLRGSAVSPHDEVSETEETPSSRLPDTPIVISDSPPDLVDAVVHHEDAQPSGKVRPMAVTLTRQAQSIKQVGSQLQYRSAYYGTLRLGSSAEDYTFVFDTGSGHLIVPSGYCHSETCKSHKRYKRSQSSTAVDILYDGTPVKKNEARDQMTVSFGTGEVTGVFVDEVVCLNDVASQASLLSLQQNTEGAELPPGCARMRIVTATEMSADPFKDFEFDGVLGLGLDGLSQTSEFNFINIFASDAISHGGDNKMFAIFLGQDSHEKSELALGGYDEDHLDGDVHWNPVLDPELGHWTVRIKSVRMGDTRVQYCDEGCKAVMDTGTSLIAVPSDSFSQFYKLLWHRAPLDGECRGPGPELTFELERGSITIGPEDYARAETCKRPAKATGFQASGTYGPTRHDMCCRPLLMSMDMPEPIGPKLFIFGEPILRKYYTVYDAERKRVGVGKAAHQEPSRHARSDATHDDDDTWFWEDDAEHLDGK